MIKQKMAREDLVKWPICLPRFQLIFCIKYASTRAHEHTSTRAHEQIKQNVKRKTFPRNHVIGFSDLVDLWVIKIKNPMILCARSTSRSSEQSTNLSCSQSNKMVWLSNMVEKFTRCAKVCGFFLYCAFQVLIGWQTRITWWEKGSTNYSHVYKHIAFLRACPLSNVFKKNVKILTHANCSRSQTE